MEIEYHYERQKHEYEVGEAVHNLNGNDYKVLEKYTDTKLLLIAKRTGELESMANLTKYEMETVVNFNAGEQTATVYTRDKCVIALFEKQNSCF